MSTRLGTVPGWERAAGWAPDNRVYEGVGPTIDLFPTYAGEELAYYWIKFDVIFYFCESPPISPVVFRTLKDCMVVQIYVSPLKEPIPEFEKWIDDITETIIADLVEDIHRMSIIEMGGLRRCGISKEENYAITITDKRSIIEETERLEKETERLEKETERLEKEKETKKETERLEKEKETKKETERLEKEIKLKVPRYILEQIEMLEDRLRESDSEEEKKIIKKTIQKLRHIHRI